jgi:uncharacterized protein
MLFLTALLIVAVLAGGTASITGFGIGSLMTPLVATRYGTPLAVAAVSVPHAIATGVRCWRLRRSIDWLVIRSFGLLSAVGGLVGALLYTRVNSRALTITLGALLIATAIAALSDWLRRLHPQGFVAQGLGFTSGLFGGMAGNQGGLRAGALLAFDLSPAALVATATATGLAVDAARMPVYVWRAASSLMAVAGPIAVVTLGVLIGTFYGERLLFGLSREAFRRIISVLIGLLGVWLVTQ